MLALDLVGFGESARPAVRYTRRRNTRGLLANFCALGGANRQVCGQWAVTGFSDLRGQHPELVSRLILHMPNGTENSAGNRRHSFSKLIYRTLPLLAVFSCNHLSFEIIHLPLAAESGCRHPADVTEEMIDVFATCAQQPAAEHAVLTG